MTMLNPMFWTYFEVTPVVVTCVSIEPRVERRDQPKSDGALRLIDKFGSVGGVFFRA